MQRYNHSLVERKWLSIVSQEKHQKDSLPRVGTVLVPGDSEAVELENARLLVLADFFASVRWGRDFRHEVVSGDGRLMRSIERLGIIWRPAEQGCSWDFAVAPRDFPHLSGSLPCSETFLCGRLLEGMALSDLLLDFGGDALRIYFLFQGPPERDYRFNWRNLMSAHRFVQRVWRLGQKVEAAGSETQEGPMAELAGVVQARIARRKPHTALAAIMAFLQNKTALSEWEVRVAADILKPFTPFLSAELLSLVAAVQDDDGGQRDQADR